MNRLEEYFHNIQTRVLDSVSVSSYSKSGIHQVMYVKVWRRVRKMRKILASLFTPVHPETPSFIAYRTENRVNRYNNALHTRVG